MNSNPFRNRAFAIDPYSRGNPEARVTRVSGASVAQRSAGVPLLRPVNAPTSLPRSADFSVEGQRQPLAYWLINGSLFIATSNQVLRDIRTAIQVPSGSPFLYSEGLIPRLRDKALQRNSSVTLPELPPPGATQMSEDWMKVALWLTYSDAPVRLNTVRLPLQTVMPDFGGDEWTPPGPESSSPIEIVSSFDPTLLASNPFQIYRTEEIDVTGERDTPPPAPSSSSAGLFLVAGAAALLLLSGRR